jgi:hypothetical protein
MPVDQPADLHIHVSREDAARLNQVAAHHDTCASEVVAVLVHHSLEHGLPPEVQAELDHARARRARA